MMLDRRSEMAQEFVISGMPEPARSDGWCWICKGVVHEGDMLQIIRFGPEDKQWSRAHASCVSESQDHETRTAGGLQINWRTLGSGEYVGNKKYSVFINEEEVYRCPDKRVTIGIVDFLEAEPRAAQALLRQHAPSQQKLR